MNIMDNELPRYREWSPTSFDSKGLNAGGIGEEDVSEWFVAPVILTRDSDTLETSNFETAKASLRAVAGENDLESASFGHWGPGWIEIILVRPGTKAAEEAHALAASLSDYPVLDEEDYSRRELEDAEEIWENMSLREKMQMCAKARISIFAARGGMPIECLDELQG